MATDTDQPYDWSKDVDFFTSRFFTPARSQWGHVYKPHDSIAYWGRMQKRNAEVAKLAPLVGFWSAETLADIVREIHRKWA
jgi:hypothetical protein